MELRNSVWNELCTTVGSHYNQDECAFCPSVFHSFAGSEHSEDSEGPLAGPYACSTSRGFLRHGYKFKISGDRKGVKLSLIPITLDNWR